jgi:hypothetical protein
VRVNDEPVELAKKDGSRLGDDSTGRSLHASSNTSSQHESKAAQSVSKVSSTVRIYNTIMIGMPYTGIRPPPWTFSSKYVQPLFVHFREGYTIPKTPAACLRHYAHYTGWQAFISHSPGYYRRRTLALHDRLSAGKWPFDSEWDEENADDGDSRLFEGNDDDFDELYGESTALSRENQSNVTQSDRGKSHPAEQQSERIDAVPFANEDIVKYEKERREYEQGDDMDVDVELKDEDEIEVDGEAGIYVNNFTQALLTLRRISNHSGLTTLLAPLRIPDPFSSSCPSRDNRPIPPPETLDVQEIPGLRSSASNPTDSISSPHTWSLATPPDSAVVRSPAISVLRSLTVSRVDKQITGAEEHSKTMVMPVVLPSIDHIPPNSSMEDVEMITSVQDVLATKENGSETPSFSGWYDRKLSSDLTSRSEKVRVFSLHFDTLLNSTIESIKASCYLNDGNKRFPMSSYNAAILNAHATDKEPNAHALTSIPESPRLPYISNSFDYTDNDFDPIYDEDFDQLYYDALDMHLGRAAARPPIGTSAEREAVKDYNENRAVLQVMEIDETENVRLVDTKEGKQMPSREDAQFNDSRECECSTPPPSPRPAHRTLPTSTLPPSTEMKNGLEDMSLAPFSSKENTMRKHPQIHIPDMIDDLDSEAVPDAYITNSSHNSTLRRRGDLTSRSLWKLQVAGFRSKFSNRGLRHSGYPPSSLSPLSNEWWTWMKSMYGQ